MRIQCPRFPRGSPGRMTAVRRRAFSLGAKLALATAALLALAIGALGLSGEAAMRGSTQATDEALQQIGDQASERERRVVVGIVAATMRVLAAGGDYSALRQQVVGLRQGDPNRAWLAVIDDRGAHPWVVTASEGSKYPVDSRFPGDALDALLAASPTATDIVVRPDPDAPERVVVGANIVTRLPDGTSSHLGQVRL